MSRTGSRRTCTNSVGPVTCWVGRWSGTPVYRAKPTPPRPLVLPLLPGPTFAPLVSPIGAIPEKRARIEERLWAIHEANIKDFFETYETAKTNKNGNLETDEKGQICTERKERPRLISDLPDDIAELVEDVTIDSKGRAIPKLYSKLQASKELRAMLNIGKPTDASDVSRLSDAELIQQLSDQAKQLGVEINLNYDFAQKSDE